VVRQRLGEGIERLPHRQSTGLRPAQFSTGSTSVPKRRNSLGLASTLAAASLMITHDNKPEDAGYFNASYHGFFPLFALIGKSRKT
jgi:hypothetical protein